MKKTGESVNEPFRSTRLLNPIERISEIIFGLIMALSFTCAISVAEAERSNIRTMLIAAIGCNVAWGLVDAVMFTITGLIQKSRYLAVMNYINKTADNGGVSAQRTRLYVTGLELQRGVFAEYSFWKMTIGFHYFNPFTSDYFFISSVKFAF